MAKQIMKQPANLSELQHLLQQHGLDLSQWGTGTTKRLIDLWHEIETGDSQLRTNPLQRHVPVVIVKVRQNGKTLIEIEQLYKDGRIRSRHNHPAEKMKPGESVEVAAMRCLKEELGLSSEQVTLYPRTHIKNTKVEESPSYPGLQTKYNFHTIEAKVTGLPTTHFWTDEETTNTTDPISKHHWDWMAE